MLPIIYASFKVKSFSKHNGNNIDLNHAYGLYIALIKALYKWTFNLLSCWILNLTAGKITVEYKYSVYYLSKADENILVAAKIA